MKDRHLRRRRAAHALVFAAAAAWGCGESTEARLMRPASLTVIPASVTLDAIGASETLRATVRDALGNTLSGVPVTFNSTDDDVVTVTPAGQVAAVGAGTVEIVVSADSLTRTTQVTVAPIPATLQRAAGDQQSAVVTGVLAQPLVVRVNDRLDNPVAGVAVAFTVASGPGTLSATRDTTGTDGQASTTLTLGTDAGPVYAVTATAAVGTASPVTFTAIGLADVAAQAAVGGGDGQRQPVNTALPQQIVVSVTDQYGNGVAGHPVAFTVTEGQGSVTPAGTETDAGGEARAAWTLGAVLGAQTVSADVGGLAGGPVVFNAVGTDLAISAVAPETLVEGQTATVTGTGFGGALDEAAVLVDGRLATVTAVTETSVDFVVPPGACEPPRDVDVVVSTVQGGTTPPTRHPWAPDSVVALAVGEHVLIQDPSEFCLHFGESVADEEYLVGIQSTSSFASALTPIRLIGQAAPGAPVPSRAPAVAATPAATAAFTIPQRWERHRAAEVALREAERRVLSERGGVAAGPRLGAAAASVVDSTVEVGQTVTVKIPTLGENLCTDFTEVTATVKAKGTRGIWLADQSNPSNGFRDGDYQDLSNALDSAIYAVDVDYFGEPTDLDGNGRVIVLVTEEVNRSSTSVLGFVSIADLFADQCPAANGGEIYYGRAPDPNGLVGFLYSREEALADAPILIAHELTHVIQAGRRLIVNNRTSFMSAFMAEGQATYAEEVVGHAILGNAQGQNYGYDVGFNTDGSSPTAWYRFGLADLAFYFGNNVSVPRTSVPGAPHECSWFTSDPEPCDGRPLWYGVTWSFLRWVSDQYGAAFPGGEREIQQRLVDNALNGLANVEDVVGVPADSLLGQWAAALYVDDRLPGLAPEVTIPSWDYFDVFVVNQPRSASLTPFEIPFADADERVDVRAGSAAYYLVGGAGRPAVAFRVRDNSDGDLPSFMQIFLVRTQ